jgi:Ca-activated chloride channel family protein
MNQSSISPDDPRLTAYAFNEMPPAERAEFEQLLQSDPAARQVVEDIRATGTLLTGVLEHEPMPAVAPQAKIIPGDFSKHDGGKEPLRKHLNKPIRFPHFYYIVSGLAAACFAMFFAYTEYNQTLAPQAKHYVELPLAATVSEAELQQELARREVADREQTMKQAIADAEQRSKEREQLLVAFNTPAPAAAPSQDTRGLERGDGLAVALPPPPPAEAKPDLNFSDFVAPASTSAAPAAIAKVGGKPRHRIAATGQAMTWKAKDVERDTEAYAYRKDNGFLGARETPLSTFSIDVDTAAYANVRRFLNNGERPPADAVRIEEMINYFPYRYQPPTGKVPFAANLEVASAPWMPEHRLVRIGLKGREVSDAARPSANLVFLLDVSGSMQSPNKLPLVKQSLRLLVDKLRADDRVAIAVYAGASGLALPSTPVSRKADILEAIDRLEAGGSTNGAMGIQLAYDIAKANFITKGVNRVILATDGDFNVGVTSEGELVRLIEEKAKSGVFLSVLGFGMGNLKDSTLESLADKGNGNYAYIDSLAEARKSLVEQAGGTLVTIAKDVKIQVEFNPAQVQAYRLIGYENRLLAKEDFNNDKVDAGEIGAGHTVTALYEVVPVGVESPVASPGVDALKYQPVAANPHSAVRTPQSSELLTVKIRYKEPTADESQLLDFPLRDNGADFEQASEDFKFAAAVASFGMLLRDSPHKGEATLVDISAWARAGIGNDAGGYRTEFLGLTERSKGLLQ